MKPAAWGMACGAVILTLVPAVVTSCLVQILLRPSDGAALGLHQLEVWVFVGGMATAAGLEAFASASIRPTVARAHGPAQERSLATVLAALTGVVLMGMTVLAVAIPIWKPGSAANGIGLAAAAILLAAGAVLRVLALARLGSRFTSDNGVVPSAGLERRGVYRFLAHPSEVGLTAIGIAGPVLFPHPSMVGLFLILTLIQVWRLYLEERALFQHYGDVYLAYRRRTRDPWPSLFLYLEGRPK